MTQQNLNTQNKIKKTEEKKSSVTYVGSLNALLGRDEDEADEDGRAQHAHSTHQRVGPLCLLAAHPGRHGTDHHTQQPRHTSDRPKDKTAHKR